MAIKFEFESNFGPGKKVIGPGSSAGPSRPGDNATAAMKRAMQRQSLKFVGDVQIKRLSGRPGLISRSAGGGLRRALSAVTFGKDVRSVESRIGWPKSFFWIKVHEEGATIRAKRKFLAIPFRGTTGSTSRRASGSGLRPGDFPRDRTFFARGKNTKPGNMILFESLGNGRIRPLFVMVPSVRIPPRLGYFRLYDRSKGAMVRGVMQEMSRFFGVQS